MDRCRVAMSEVVIAGVGDGVCAGASVRARVEAAAERAWGSRVGVVEGAKSEVPAAVGRHSMCVVAF